MLDVYVKKDKFVTRQTAPFKIRKDLQNVLLEATR